MVLTRLCLRNDFAGIKVDPSSAMFEASPYKISQARNALDYQLLIRLRPASIPQMPRTRPSPLLPNIAEILSA